MAATKQAPRTTNGAGVRRLPAISVAKFREALLQLEHVVSENTATFIEHGQAYRDQHRHATGRPLTAEEVAMIARGLDTNLADARQQITDADLAAYDEPQPQEILLAAGVATTPGLFDAVLRLAALVEMPNDAFQDAREADSLDHALDEAVAGLDDVGLIEQRDRAAAAWDHLSVAMGYQPGKAWGLIAKTMWQAISQGMSHLTIPASPSSTDSPATTTGPEPTSSTPSAG